jgi:hypothetical protein
MSQSQMMGRKAHEAAHVMIEQLGLQGQMTAEGFIEEREAELLKLFPYSDLMPGEKPQHMSPYFAPKTLFMPSGLCYTPYCSITTY